MYTDEELHLIWQELDFLTYSQKLADPSEYFGAKDSLGNYLSNAKALVLDAVYQKREYSNILTINRKLFTEGYTQIFSELSPDLKFIPNVNSDTTKIRYYQNGEYYRPHTDYSFAALSLSYFYREPKQFSGGQLIFPSYNYKFDCSHNSMILIPGYVEHGVNEIKTEETPYSGNSRYCITQFLFYNFPSPPT
jgi:Rps23 Pro-64 3,4-dihydroxylase Tpa1-like proline 4-hydroxylase